MKLCTKFHQNRPSFIEDITDSILVSFFLDTLYIKRKGLQSVWHFVGFPPLRTPLFTSYSLPQPLHTVHLLSQINIASHRRPVWSATGILGPILFLVYTSDLLWLVETNNLCPHLYADDTQVHGVCRAQQQRQLPTSWRRGRGAIDPSLTQPRPGLFGARRVTTTTISRTSLTVGNNCVTPSAWA